MFIVLKLKKLFVYLTVLFAAVFVIPIIYYKSSLYSANNILDTKNTKAKIAIILDDLGSSRDGVDEMIKIKRPLTFAVMPFYDISKEQADKVHKNGYEVIIHLPMESKSGAIKSLGPRAIKTSMKDDEVKKVITDSFDLIPYAVGANIHMGSKASEDERIMECILSNIKDKKLYFIDSKTSGKGVGKKIANKLGVNFLERDVFLEAESKNKNYVKKQISLAEKTALKKGIAVVIGHVGPAGGKATAEAIEEMVHELERKGIKLVFVSELFEELN